MHQPDDDRGLDKGGRLEEPANDESKALLGDEPRERDLDDDERDFLKQPPTQSTINTLRAVIAGVVLLTLASLALRPLTYRAGSSERVEHDNLDFAATGGVRSNGTHLFRKTVLMVSIDGLRADYLDRGLTPHLFEISQVGLRAEYMRPIFPTITFPNHWSILTGLYAESHGIVGNNFWDPETSKEFMYSDPNMSWDPHWWGGEPIWETLEKAGVKTANLMWIGPPQTKSGAKPTYFVPWRNHVPLHEKLSSILSWIDMPFDQRPQLILAYEPSLDQAGHKAGPGSALVNNTLADVDQFMKDLHSSLGSRNLTDIVDIIFVSDHGMVDTSHVENVYLEDIIGREGVDNIEHEDGWPSMGLRFRGNNTFYFEKLKEAASLNPNKFDVYSPETMPNRFHFSNNQRIAPIYVIPQPGFALEQIRDKPHSYSRGNHGFDNHLPSMHAVFVADGPFTDHVKSKRAIPSKRDEAYVIEGFQNVEVKSLIGRLLGVEINPRTHNGTAGFWDKYLLD